MAVCHSPMIAAMCCFPYACSQFSSPVKEEFSAEREAGAVVFGLKRELALSSSSMESPAIFFLFFFMVTMYTWRGAASFSIRLFSASLPEVTSHQACKMRAGSSAATMWSLMALRGWLMPPRLWMISEVARGTALGQAGFLSCRFLAGEGVSGDGQPCSDRGLLSKCSLVDAVSTAGEAGTGS